MKTILSTTAIALCLAASAGLASAQDAMKKDGMAQDSMSKPMTMQQCKDRMAMSSNGMKKDDASMKMDAMCADMMKKGDTAGTGNAIPAPDTMASGAMKK